MKCFSMRMVLLLPLIAIGLFLKAQTNGSLTGKVVDSLNNPIEDVEVSNGNSMHVTTAKDGSFSIKGKSGDLIRFSRVGYQIVAARITQDNQTIVLPIVKAVVDEVVVVGFGTQKKQNVTGSVYQVGAKELENRPVNNIGQALQGLVPNLNISNGNGSPNSTPSLNIRGGTSFAKDANGNDIVATGSPYTLVDGIEMDINLLNPEDIESISVLSDAASSAIYGARAAYGVVLVTTKKGRHNQRVNVAYSNSFQWNKPTSVPDLLTSTQVQQAVVDAYGLTGNSIPADAQTLLDSIKAYAADPSAHNPYYMNGKQIIWNANVNPYDVAVSNAALTQKHNISLSGGSEKNSYYASIGYLSQDGLYKINTDKFKRYNFMLNTSSTVTDWFKIDFKSNYSRTTYSSPVNPSGKRWLVDCIWTRTWEKCLYAVADSK